MSKSIARTTRLENIRDLHSRALGVGRELVKLSWEAGRELAAIQSDCARGEFSVVLGSLEKDPDRPISKRTAYYYLDLFKRYPSVQHVAQFTSVRKALAHSKERDERIAAALAEHERERQQLEDWLDDLTANADMMESRLHEHPAERRDVLRKAIAKDRRMVALWRDPVPEDQLEANADAIRELAAA